MRLSSLIAGLNFEIHNYQEIEVNSLEFDSRRVKPGALFIAIKGEKFDGHDFIQDAVRCGAVALVTERKVESSLPQLVCQQPREAMAILAKRFYGSFDELTKIGITGTNGKTTTAFLIHSILKVAGQSPGLISTVAYLGRSMIKAVRTTPESLDIFKLMHQFRAEGIRSVVMEVSSHALALKRVDELRFQVALFTNLSQDHLDFHKTMANYKKAKLHLFDLLTREGFAVFNADDPISFEINKLGIKNRISFGLRNSADITGKIVEDSLDGLRMEITYNNNRYPIYSSLIGAFNSYNILASFCAGLALNIEPERIRAGIEQLTRVKGRMEQIRPGIFIDFCHTPKALENVLQSLRKYLKGDLILVFGCGGDRDRDKRPKMGRIATELADFVIITSDNPRQESPSIIIEEIKEGVVKPNYKIIEDRQEAIRDALRQKKPNDILLIAGRGHEEYQILKDRVIEFDDAEVVRECLRSA